MTRKVTRNYSLSVVAAFIAILTLLIAAAVLAQTSGAGQMSGQANAVLAPAGTSALAQAERPLMPRTDRAGRSPVSRSQTKRHGARPMDGNPLFLPAVAYDSGGLACGSNSCPMGIAVADVNRDGKPDILVTNMDSNTVGVLLGNGDGTFQPAVTYNTPGQAPSGLAIGELNGDGKPDLIVGLLGGAVGVLLGNGDGTFQPVVIYGSGGTSVLGIAVADFNLDGKLDVVVANQWGGVGVLLGNGDGTLQPVATFGSGGGWPSSVAAADVNGDGKPDIVVTNDASTNVGVLLGNGDGTFQPAVSYGWGVGFSWPMSVAVADVNGDNKPDLVVANCSTNMGGCGGAQEGLVVVLLGNGDGTFQPALTYGSGGNNAYGVAVADVNGDGKPDVAVANSYSWNVGVLFGNGDGTLQSVVAFASGGIYANAVTLADVNGDGRPDLVVANVCSQLDGCNDDGVVGVLLNNTGPHLSTNTALVSSLNPAPPHTLVTYTATVTNQEGGVVTGSVTFREGKKVLATVELANNQAQFSTKYTKSGPHAITATYSGDLYNSGSTSPTLTEYIEYASTTTLATSGSPSFVGQPVTFTATVTSTHGAIPDGELVTFYDGTAAIGTGATAGGVATFTTSSLTVNTHTIKAAYAGDAIFAPSTGSVKQVVVKYPTTTTLSSSLNPSNYGQAVTFTATVTPTGPYPLTGKVKFLDGTVGIGWATLSGGVAKLTKSTLAAGTHPITAEYVGDAYNAKSTSPVLNQVVQ